MAWRRTSLFLVFALLPGCFATFSQRNAQEVTREKLLAVSEKGTSNHLQYMGSDFNYHYVYDTRPGKERSYKVRVTDIKLTDTFAVGEDSYVLHPWVIEGKLLGTPPDDLAEEMRKSARKTRPYASTMDGSPQAVVKSPAESDVGEDLGDDQVESSRVETP
ncbi:MAG TPA: hypothetical protein VGM05_32615 [Planctomycetaceae bacterium]|jgi:hypothetical protein